MIEQFLLTLRETLEASLIVAIVYAYLRRSQQADLLSSMWYGVLAAVVASLTSGVLVWFAFGNLSGPAETLFEGITALAAVLVLSSMIYWMAIRGKTLKAELERQVKAIATTGEKLAMTSFIFVIVLREGLETVLFLAPFLLTDALGTVVGGLVGLLSSLVLAYLVFSVGVRIEVRRFFYLTSILLVLMAAGLAGSGVHELVEYSNVSGIKLGWLGEDAFVLGVPEGSIWHPEGAIGSILAAMFGYAVEFEWARLLLQCAYLAVALSSVFWAYKQ